MPGISASDRVRIWNDATTGECGLQIRVINKTGGNSIKGYCCKADITTPTDRGVVYCPKDIPDPIGFVYDVVADGADMWLWIAGMVEIYVTGNATVGQFARTPVDADADDTSGRITSEAAPSAPFESDKHWQEVGHIMKARTGAGLTLAIIHFN
jgi:hypothetical protein